MEQDKVILDNLPIDVILRIIIHLFNKDHYISKWKNYYIMSLDWRICKCKELVKFECILKHTC